MHINWDFIKKRWGYNEIFFYKCEVEGAQTETVVNSVYKTMTAIYNYISISNLRDFNGIFHAGDLDK